MNLLVKYEWETHISSDFSSSKIPLTGPKCEALVWTYNINIMDSVGMLRESVVEHIQSHAGVDRFGKMGDGTQINNEEAKHYSVKSWVKCFSSLPYDPMQ